MIGTVCTVNHSTFSSEMPTPNSQLTSKSRSQKGAEDTTKPQQTPLDPRPVDNFGANKSTPLKSTTSQTLLDQLNHKLYPQGLEAVFQFDNHSRMTWINVVNKATGQVIEQYPPEAVRQMVDQAAGKSAANHTSSLAFDSRA